MKISFSMPIDMGVTSTGFGVAGLAIVQSLQALGHHVPYRDSTAKLEIAVGHPPHWEWSNPEAYHIAYFPWESDELQPGWAEIINTQNVDELWTPSPLVAGWLRKLTYKPVYVYQHGVDAKVWTPSKRTRRDGVLRFVHSDGAAHRKNAAMTLVAFKKAFGDRDDVLLTFKSVNPIANIGNLIARNNNVDLKLGAMNINQLTFFYKNQDVLVLPTAGEGFGLVPLECLASGMPVITTGAVAPYKTHLIEDLTLESTLTPSPWPSLHPGNVMQPDIDELEEKFKIADKQFNRFASLAYAQSALATYEYDWVKLTQNAFDRVINKVENES